AIDPQDEAALESQIGAIKARSGAELAIYVQVDPSATQDSNLAAAHSLLDQWHVGRAGFDDGLVMLVSLQADRVHGQVSLYGGSGFRRGYLSEGDMEAVIDQVLVPAARPQQPRAGPAAHAEHDADGPRGGGAGRVPQPRSSAKGACRPARGPGRRPGD